MDFSIIIPVYHEEEIINHTISHINQFKQEYNIEIIIVDGNQKKSTIKKVECSSCILLTSKKSRAIQMNAGAQIARGKILIFLHADTQLPGNALQEILKVIYEDHYPAGAFDFKIGTGKWIFRIIENNSNIRSRITRIPYGDQVHFFHRDYFFKIGMYKEIPIMEDIEIMQRIKKRKDKIFIIKNKVTTSGRRWLHEGILKCTIRNWILSFLYYLGVSPNKLANFYK